MLQGGPRGIHMQITLEMTASGRRGGRGIAVKMARPTYLHENKDSVRIIPRTDFSIIHTHHLLPLY